MTTEISPELSLSSAEVPVAAPNAPVTYLQQQAEQLPLLGPYVGRVLQHRYVESIALKVDPYVEGSVQKTMPYVQSACSHPVVQKGATVVQEGVRAVARAPAAIQAAPRSIYETTVATPRAVGEYAINTTTSIYENAVAAPRAVGEYAINTTTSAVGAAQPYVHSAVSTAAPYVSAAVDHPSVQSLYQQPTVQSTIEKATPYISSVVQHPRLQGVASSATSVLAWATPAASAVPSDQPPLGSIQLAVPSATPAASEVSGVRPALPRLRLPRPALPQYPGAAADDQAEEYFTPTNSDDF